MRPFLSTLLVAALATVATAQTSSDPKAEIAQLKAQAEAKTKAIGELAQKGALPTSDEAIRLLQQMVEELKETRERLKRLEGDAAPVASSSRLKWQGYAQLQYQDTNRIGSDRTTVNNDGFRYRRLRVGFVDQISPRLSSKAVFEFAGGSDNNTAVSREVYFAYDISGSSKLGRDSVWMGQFQVPLGYEIERSSGDRELPERAQYNQIMFNTERSRGVEVRRATGRWFLKGALVDSLTIGDSEINGQVPGSGNRLAFVGQAKYSPSKETTVGLSAMVARRPEFATSSAISPSVPRQFLFADAKLGKLINGKLTIYGEAMIGKDRLPSTTANPNAFETDMAGYHIASIFDLSGRDRLAYRWEAFDPDLDSGGNSLNGMNFAYIRDLTSTMKLTLGYCYFQNESRRAAFNQAQFNQTILRMQFRF